MHQDHRIHHKIGNFGDRDLRDRVVRPRCVSMADGSLLMDDVAGPESQMEQKPLSSTGCRLAMAMASSCNCLFWDYT